MYLFAARVASKRGMAQEAAGQMMKSRDLLSSLAGFPFYAWAGVAGVPLGTYFLSARVESMEQYMEASGVVTQSNEYHLQAKASSEDLEGPTETALGQVLAVAGEMGDEPKPLLVVTTATVAAGRQVDAATWGIELMNYAAEKGGTNGIFAASVVGNINEVSWIQGHDDGAGIDRALAALMTDDGYLERIGEAEDLVVAGSGRRFVMAKLP